MKNDYSKNMNELKQEYMAKEMSEEQVLEMKTRIDQGKKDSEIGLKIMEYRHKEDAERRNVAET